MQLERWEVDAAILEHREVDDAGVVMLWAPKNLIIRYTWAGVGDADNGFGGLLYNLLCM